MSPDERAFLQYVGGLLLQDFAMLIPIVLLQGVFIMLFSFSTFTLLQRDLASRPTQAMLGTTLIAFLVSSFYCISIISSFATFVKEVLMNSAGTLEESIFKRVNERNTVPCIIQAITSTLMPILSDAVVIWRAWVLYPDKLWIMLVPCALVSGTIGVTVAFLVLVFKSIQNHKLDPASSDMFSVSLALSLGTNIVATSLIFYRLWGHLRSLRRMGNKQKSTTPAQKILIVLVESGLVYCALQTTTLVLEFVPTSRVSSVNIAGSVIMGFLVLVTAMYPSIVVTLVSLQRSTAEIYGFSTQFGFRPASDVMGALEVNVNGDDAVGFESLAVTRRCSGEVAQNSTTRGRSVSEAREDGK
ncbi:hypothetical protein D9615_010157 [Tricholomella constricta]|uniref:Uncharacterized protein n=1 Tax=Tricholomella constricta TaxID=117010 RepID=A0A8H5GS04_9AGAR|nr:hypothetical protein D9615_010157 [Tricholomella constricta]